MTPQMVSARKAVGTNWTFHVASELGRFTVSSIGSKVSGWLSAKGGSFDGVKARKPFRLGSRPLISVIRSPGRRPAFWAVLPGKTFLIAIGPPAGFSEHSRPNPLVVSSRLPPRSYSPVISDEGG